MAVQSIIKNTVNLDEPIKKQILTDVLGGSDNQAHRFEVELTRGGQAVSLSGATVYGYFIRPGDITVKLTGGVSGSTAYVVLNEHCYVTPGRFSFAMKVQVGEVLHTVLLYEGCVAVTQGEGVVDDGYTIPSLTEWMNNIRKANLLDNSDFSNPVAQAGFNGLHGSKKYVCDRWISWNVDAVFENGYMTTGSPYDQSIDPAKIDIAKTYTAAIGLADGNIIAYSGNFASGFGFKASGIFGGLSTDNTTPFVRIASGQNVRWAALYEGSYTAETLPAYVPKGYAAELLECQRYYIKIAAQPVNGWCYNWGRATMFVPTPVQMRTTNTTVTLAVSNPVFYIGSTSYNATLASGTAVNNGINVMYSHSVSVSGQCVIPEFSAEISADL